MRSLILVSVLALGVVAVGGPAAAEDVRMYVHHEVNDYAAWRKVYNDFDPTDGRWVSPRKRSIGQSTIRTMSPSHTTSGAQRRPRPSRHRQN